MATYCYRCLDCGEPTTQNNRTAGYECPCGGALARDYRAENVGVAVVQLQREREAGGRENLDRLFLPSNKDFAGPGDPDGTKGMRNWRETHQPKAGNKAPRWPGTVDREVM